MEDVGPDSPTESQGRLNQLVSDISQVTVQGASDPRYLGSLSGASFSRVVFAAIKSSTSVGGSRLGKNSGGQRSDVRSGDAEAADMYSNDSRKEVTGVREGFFGLATSRECVQPAKWPSRQLASDLIGLYFGQANPQLPILHRGEFEAMADQVYSDMKMEQIFRERGETEPTPEMKTGPRERYLMHIVFAIGAGIFLEKDTGGGSDDDKTPNRKSAPTDSGPESAKENIIDSGDLIHSPSTCGDGTIPESSNMSDEDDVAGPQTNQETPEAYHAAAHPHLEAFLSSKAKSGLEELQAVLLLAGYALIRPVPPGLWYIVGVAVRLAIDLGLHLEVSNASAVGGAFEAQIDLRRRLWWCTYSMDRLVSICVGRPLGIQDEAVSTKVRFIIQFVTFRLMQ